MDEYADILSEIRTEKGIQKVSPFQETPSEVETDTDWYNGMISQSKKAGELVSDLEVPEKKIDLSWSETLREKTKPSPIIETAAHFGYGIASWIPSKLSGLGQIGFQKLNNAIFGSEAKNIKRTSEERELFKKGVYSPEKIREMADQSEALWQILPPPESKEAKFVLEKIGGGLDTILTPFRIADEYYTKKGFPNLGYALRFAGEILFFKAVHGFGVRSSAKIKKLRIKVRKKAPAVEVEKTLEEVFDEIGIPKKEIIPKGDELKRVTKSQKIRAHKIQREKGLSKAEYMEIAERISGETSIKDMNRDIAKRFIEELKKGKEGLEKARGIEKGEEVKVEKKEEVVEEVKETEKVKEEKMEEVKEEEVKIEEVKPEPPSEVVKTLISDDIRTAEDMGIYAEVKEMLGEKKKVGEIMKEVKQKAYYKEDLADFGITEKDIRESIRAIKAEMGDEGAIKQIQTVLKKEKKKVEKITETEEIKEVSPKTIELVLKENVVDVEATKALLPKEAKGTVRLYRAESPTVKFEDVFDVAEMERFKPPEGKVGEFYTEDLKYADYFRSSYGKDAIIKYIDVSKKTAQEGKIRDVGRYGPIGEYIIDIQAGKLSKRVDPETGRPAGVKEDLITAPKEMDEARMRYELEQMPITKEDGSIAKSKFVAMKRAKELGRIGDLVKNPKGEGWLVKKTKEQRETKAKEESKEWEEILKEEELGDLGDEGLGERVDVDIDTVFDPLKGEKGAITFHRKTVKELKRIVKKGYYTRNRIIRELRKRGASDEDILKVFPDASVRILNKGKESKWWKEGQDPLALLPRRTLPNKLKAPAITRGEAHMIATMKDMPARLTAEHLSWENAIRTFEKLPKEMKETFYRSVKEGESLAFDHLQDVLKRSKKIRQSVNYFSHKRIGTHAIAQQPDGIAVLAQQGITKIPKLKPNELKAYEDLRTIYKEFFVSVNRARIAAGEKPFPPIDNYFTWIQDITYLSKVEGVGLFSNWRTIESKMAEIKKVPSFRFAKFRAGPEKPRKLNLNPFTVIDTYAKTATHYVEMAPRLAKLNELLTEKYGMAQKAPHAYNFIRHWLNLQAGKIPAWDIAHPTTRWAMRKLNSNIVYSLLAFNVRSALIQPAAMASSYAMLGEYYMGVGLSHAMSPAKWKMAGKKSNVLNTRSPETAIYEAMEASGKFPSMFKKRVAKVGMAPLTILDSASARITWLGAYAKGLKKFKSESKAINYADDIVTRTQASAAKSDIAPIQRTQLGKTVTCLQTFVINHWGFLTKDVMGIKNADIKNPVIVKRVIRFILATTAMNALYEDGLGLNSPNPTPIRAYREMFEETADHKKAFARGVKEIAEYIPLWGGRLRYGSEIGGPVLSELLKLIENGDVDALIKLMGIPGSNQFFKMVRAYERSGTDVDIALGRYVDPDEDKIKSLTDSIKSP